MYNISKLTEFNKALVYGFDPEASPARTLGSQQYKDNLYMLAGQHLDVLNAYLYAQDTILPFVKRQGIDTISETQLLEWILTIHQHIGKHLLACFGEISGQYSTGDIQRWQHGGDVFFKLADLINDVITFDSRAKTFINDYCSQYKVDKKTCATFIDIVKHFRKESLDELAGKINPFARNPELVMRVIDKMAAARRQPGILSTKETKALDEIVIFCLPPHEIPAAMQHFAQEMLIQYRKCRTANVREVAEILAELFYQFTKTHPFANANGRTATCLINVILRSLELPDVLLRVPGDRDDAASDYSKAMACISQTRAPFAEHIFNCIEKAKQQPFQNTALAEIIELRVQFSLKCQDLEKTYSAFNIEHFRKETEKKIDKLTLSADEEKFSIIALKECIRLTEETEKKLRSSSLPKSTLFSKSLNPLAQYNDALRLYKDGQFDHATELLLLAIEGFQQKSGENSSEVAKCYSALTSVYRDSHKLDLAIRACAKSLACLESLGSQALDPILTKYAQCLNLHNPSPSVVYSRAVTDYKNKHLHGAFCQLQYCLEQWKKTPENDSHLASCYSTMASCQRELGRFIDALHSCDEGLKLCGKDPDKFQAIMVKKDNLLKKLSEIQSNETLLTATDGSTIAALTHRN